MRPFNVASKILLSRTDLNRGLGAVFSESSLSQNVLKTTRLCHWRPYRWQAFVSDTDVSHGVQMYSKRRCCCHIQCGLKETAVTHGPKGLFKNDVMGQGEGGVYEIMINSLILILNKEENPMTRGRGGRFWAKFRWRHFWTAPNHILSYLSTMIYLEISFILSESNYIAVGWEIQWFYYWFHTQ